MTTQRIFLPIKRHAQRVSGMEGRVRGLQSALHVLNGVQNERDSEVATC